MKKIFLFAICVVAATMASCKKDNPAAESEDNGENYVEYGGVRYKTVKLGDNIWFAENLRYVPGGYTVSDDYSLSNSSKDHSIFYPAKKTGVSDSKVAYEKGSAGNTGLNTEKGLLYNMTAYMQLETLPSPTDTAANKAYNGARGICPEGWHIPSAEDWNTLVSFSTKSDIWKIQAEENTKALFYEVYTYDKNGTPTEAKHSSIVKANELGFNFCPVGTVTATMAAPYSTACAKYPAEFESDFSLTYYACSTICRMGSVSRPDIQPYAVMTTMTGSSYPHGRISLAQGTSNYGVSVRCVKPAK